ncbi:MAG: family 43 glycosylhydrolase [Bacteroidales bacterium]|jgi:arabinan endo-1,5-alpha-L-arabinosidase|nr:family 43 glycosylhydrolase [Bacteroidales bacterium]
MKRKDKSMNTIALKSSVYLSLVYVTLLSMACTSESDDVLIWSDAPSTAASTYTNPIFEPDLADPTLIKANDGWFYAYGTENTWASGVHRLVPIVKSKDLMRWSYVGDAFTEKPDWKSDGGLWAPDINYNSADGQYYLYYSISTWGDADPGIGVATSATPFGPFTDLGKVFLSSEIGVGNSIDPFYMEIGEGRNFKRYLFWGSFRGIYGIEMSQDMITTVGRKFQIANNNFEATYIHFKDGQFYFFGSSGSCCEGIATKYRVVVAKADNIKGPYLDKQGTDIRGAGATGELTLSGDANKAFVGPGHNAGIITDSEGNDWILYHAIATQQTLFEFSGVTRRPLMLDRVDWVDEWPVIRNGFPSSSLQEGPVF